MSYEDKAMASRSSSPSPKTIVQDSDYGRVMSVCPSIERPQLPIQHSGLNGPVAILWDIENCPVPSDVRPEDVAGNIRMALQVHPVIKGAVTMFSAYGDFNAFPRRLREGCQRTGVKLVDVPNGRKDAADKAILVDMFLYALDNRPPSSIMLISGDVDFAPALHILGQRGYTIILVIPAGVGVSSALSNAGRFVWDWPSVAHGEGFVPPKALVPRGSDLAGYLMSCTTGDNHDTQNEEESIVYRGSSHCESSTRVNINQAYRYNYSHVSRDPSRASNFMSDYTCNNIMSGPYFNSSRSQSLLVGLNDNPAVNQNCTQEETWWVRPGDLQGLKGQLVRLLEMSGGSLPLVRVPAEYLKVSGRPLYMAEYGVYKLVNLFKKMTDAFIVVGKGYKKVLCLRNFGDRNVKKCPSTPAMEGKEKKGKGVLEENTDIGIPPSGSSSEELSDDERNVCTAIGAEYRFDDNIGTFRQEIQELLVCYSCPVPLHIFEALYEQRYKKALDYQSFGVEGLEELIEKVRDVVELRDDRASNRKFLVSSYASG